MVTYGSMTTWGRRRVPAPMTASAPTTVYGADLDIVADLRAGVNAGCRMNLHTEMVSFPHRVVTRTGIMRKASVAATRANMISASADFLVVRRARCSALCPCCRAAAADSVSTASVSPGTTGRRNLALVHGRRDRPVCPMLLHRQDHHAADLRHRLNNQNARHDRPAAGNGPERTARWR